MASKSVAASSYSDLVLAHFRQPAHAGLPDQPEIHSWVVARAGKRAHGTQFTLAARVQAGSLEQIRFAAYGCPHAIAAADWVTGQLEGQAVETLRAFRGLDIQQPLAVPAEKLPVLLLLEDAVQALAKAIAAND